MVPLYKYITESTIVETKISKSVAELLNSLTRSSSIVRQYDIKHMFKWNDIQDEDIHEISTSDALRAADREKDVLIIWYDAKDIPSALTLDKQILWVGPGVITKYASSHSTPRYVTTISKRSSRAMIIYNISKYSTTELRERRKQSHESAVALQDNSSIAQNNVWRYKKEIISKMHDQLDERVEEVYNKCTAVLDRRTAILADLYNVLISDEEQPELDQLIILFKQLNKELQILISKWDESRSLKSRGYRGPNAPLQLMWLYDVPEVRKSVDKILSICSSIDDTMDAIQSVIDGVLTR